MRIQKNIRSKIIKELYKIAKHYIFMITAMVVCLGGVVVGIYVQLGADIEKVSSEIIMSLLSGRAFIISSISAIIVSIIKVHKLNNNKEITLICLAEVIVVLNVFYEIPWKSAILCFVICVVFRWVYECVNNNDKS